jgi:hypothetical protein
MASKYLQKFPVPQGFQDILADFTKEVLRVQPPNIVEFAAHYFEGLEKGRKNDFGSTRKIDGVSSKYNLIKFRDAEEMTKRASNIASKIGEVYIR